MKSKIIEMDPEKRAVKLAWEDFKRSVDQADASTVKSALFYLESTISSLSVNLSVFGPDWTLTGRVKTFMTELEMENFILDFGEVSEEDELPLD